MSGADQLNYHHLRYFWAVANEGSLTGTARKLRVSQSALSTQIKQLEAQLGMALFMRVGRRLELTEAGAIAKSYAEKIFSSGSELVATLEDGRRRQTVLRVGAIATLSRNFQVSFVSPLLDQPDLWLRMHSGSLEELLSRLSDHDLDLVLSNRPVRRDDRAFRCRRIARQEVSLVGRPLTRPFRFPDDLATVTMLLPSTDSAIRMAFDTLCDHLGISVQIRGEVDDMAMMRLLARDFDAVALLPSVVVRDELQAGTLEEYCVVPDLHETFYGITVDRKYQHPLVEPLLARGEQEILAMHEGAD